MNVAYSQKLSPEPIAYSDLMWIAQFSESTNHNYTNEHNPDKVKTSSRFSQAQRTKISHAIPELSDEQHQNFEMLQRNVVRAREQHGIQILTLTSATRGEGASTISYFLAMKLASTYTRQNRPSRVLLIDANPIQPSLHHLFGIQQQTGLVKISLKENTLPTAGTLNLMTSRISVGYWQHLIQSGKFQYLMNRLRTSFDYIILDTPAVLAYEDTAILGRLTDGILLVVKNNPIQREALAAARQRLSRNHAEILGVILNDFDNTNHNRTRLKIRQNENPVNRS